MFIGVLEETCVGLATGMIFKFLKNFFQDSTSKPQLSLGCYGDPKYPHSGEYSNWFVTKCHSSIASSYHVLK